MSLIDEESRRAALPLQPGDRLNAIEFRHRNERMPEGTKAELVEGIVYMAAAVKLDHGQPHMFLGAWMTQYCFATPGVDYSDNVTHQLDEDNEPQPDLSLFIDPARGGQVSISDDGYLVGGPELIAEIAVSSVTTDRGPKRRVYERHGVREYIIWRVEENIIEWYALRGGTFELLPIGKDGVLRSKIFPGLWMDIEATLRRDGPEAMELLRQGLATHEHAKFVEKLRK